MFLIKIPIQTVLQFIELALASCLLVHHKHNGLVILSGCTGEVLNVPESDHPGVYVMLDKGIKQTLVTMLKVRVSGDCGFGIFKYSNEQPLNPLTVNDDSLDGYFYTTGDSYQNGHSEGNEDGSGSGNGGCGVFAVEVDAAKRTFRFFINGRLQPVFYTNIPTPLKFIMHFRDIGTKFEVLSWQVFAHSLVNASTPMYKRNTRRVVNWNYEAGHVKHR